MEKMRTRFLPKMTHDEVCEYVKRNDIIYVPFGTVEVHGTFPLDVETTTPEAFALLMAEETDGLVLGNLPYFFCGASPIRPPGTIQMSVEQGLAYLKAIAHSLLNQGFRRAGLPLPARPRLPHRRRAGRGTSSTRPSAPSAMWTWSTAASTLAKKGVEDRQLRRPLLRRL